MKPRILLTAWILGSTCACMHESAIHSNEILDERSGISVAALHEPIEFVQSEGIAVGKRASFAYLGPVEWDRMGDVRYGLWLHVAPGNDKPVADIHTDSAVRVMLEDGPWTLTTLADPPQLGAEPYRTQVSWGQVAYFQLDAEMLKRLAANRIVSLDLLGADGSVVHFTTPLDTRPTLAAYAQSRHITDD
jgi:hypothetical protein